VEPLLLVAASLGSFNASFYSIRAACPVGTATVIVNRGGQEYCCLRELDFLRMDFFYSCTLVCLYDLPNASNEHHLFINAHFDATRFSQTNTSLPRTDNTPDKLDVFISSNSKSAHRPRTKTILPQPDNSRRARPLRQLKLQHCLPFSNDP
jgi:hypothetical protein